MLELYTWLIMFDSRFASLLFPFFECLPNCRKFLFREHLSPRFLKFIWLLPIIIQIIAIIVEIERDFGQEDHLDFVSIDSQLNSCRAISNPRQFRRKLKQRGYAFLAVLMIQILLGFIQVCRAHLQLQNDATTKQMLWNMQPSQQQPMHGESIDEPLNFSGYSDGTYNCKIVNNEIERMMQLSRQFRPLGLTTYRVYNLRMRLTRRSLTGFIYLILALFMVICALFENGMFIIPHSGGIHFKSTGTPEIVCAALVQPTITLYFHVFLVVAAIMIATFALSVFIKLTSLFSFLCCPMLKYRIQKCFLDHRYRKFNKSDGDYKRYRMIQGHEDNLEQPLNKGM